MNKSVTTKKGFTLIEILTVIAILAILGAIIFPTVGQFRTLAKKSSDSSDLRNIVQASLFFAAQNGERLVGPDQTLSGDGVTDSGGGTIVDVAAVLAYGGDLNDPKVWVSANESDRMPNVGGLYTTTAGTGDDAGTTIYSKNGSLQPTHFSYSYVSGLKTFDSATTPVVFTRKSGEAGAWGENDPYSTEGGHIAFLGGNVTWYDDVEGQLIGSGGNVANTIDDAVTGKTIIKPEAAE